MNLLAHCDHCERTFDDTEEVFVSPNGGDLCAHCAATWLGEERARLTRQLAGAVERAEAAERRVEELLAAEAKAWAEAEHWRDRAVEAERWQS